MFEFETQPRFSETDALGHVNNVTMAIWFEEARTRLFEIFNPTLNVKQWNLILAHTAYDFLGQIYYGTPVTIKTYVTKLGNASLNVGHEVWQNDTMVGKGKAVLVHFNYASQQSEPIPPDARQQLEQHLRPELA